MIFDDYNFCLSGNLKRFMSSYDFSLHMYAITVFKDSLYWTDWTEKSIFKVAKNYTDAVAKNGTNAKPKPLRGKIENIRDIHVYDESRQTGSFTIV